MREILQDCADRYNGLAKGFELLVANELKAQGYQVKREVWVDDRGDGRRGRIDLVASKDNEVHAIELDLASPRMKSALKLLEYPATHRWIVLRNKPRLNRYHPFVTEYEGVETLWKR